MQERSNTYHHAKRELDILIASSTDPNDRPIVEDFYNELLELCDRFGKSGQSGGSAPMVAACLSRAVKTLCMQEPICPLTGLDDEWFDHTESNSGKPLFQNLREGAVFKDAVGAYYLDAIVWKSQNGDTFTGAVQGILSRQYIKQFPFEPKTFYIDVLSKEVDPGWWEHSLKSPSQLKKIYNVYQKINP